MFHIPSFPDLNSFSPFYFFLPCLSSSKQPLYMGWRNALPLSVLRKASRVGFQTLIILPAQNWWWKTCINTHPAFVPLFCSSSWCELGKVLLISILLLCRKMTWMSEESGPSIFFFSTKISNLFSSLKWNGLSKVFFFHWLSHESSIINNNSYNKQLIKAHSAFLLD